MEQDLKKLSASLQASGNSVTEQRKLVFLALLGNSPMTMQELATAVSPRVNRASTYRIIELFEKLGIVQRLQLGWKYQIELSDDFIIHHHHMTCTVCETVYELEENTMIEHELKQVAMERNFIMQHHQLEIRGICNNCA